MAELFGIRGMEASSVYRIKCRDFKARAVGEEEAVATKCPSIKDILALYFAKLFILGCAEQARVDLIRLGTRKFGTPAEEVTARIDAMVDIDLLEDLIDLVLEVASWDELLQMLASREESTVQTLLPINAVYWTRPSEPVPPR